MQASKDAAKLRQFQGEPVRYSSQRDGGEGDANGVLFNPDGRNLGVLHEWWGLNDFTLNASSKIAESGFCVLAADVFRGHLYTDFAGAKKNMAEMDVAKATDDITVAVTYLRSIGCKKIGITGFSFGAKMALATAAMHPDVCEAVVPNCGTLGTLNVAQIKAKVQGHFALHDKVVGVASPDDVGRMEEELKKGGVEYEIKWYDAKHAFCVPDYEQNYDAKATEMFFTNLCAFFKQTLADN
jgi:carboxymethylenebutenolidase